MRRDAVRPPMPQPDTSSKGPGGEL